MLRHPVHVPSLIGISFYGEIRNYEGDWHFQYNLIKHPGFSVEIKKGATNFKNIINVGNYFNRKSVRDAAMEQEDFV